MCTSDDEDYVPGVGSGGGKQPDPKDPKNPNTGDGNKKGLNNEGGGGSATLKP